MRVNGQACLKRIRSPQLQIQRLILKVPQPMVDLTADTDMRFRSSHQTSHRSSKQKVAQMSRLTGVFSDPGMFTFSQICPIDKLILFLEAEPLASSQKI